VDRDDEDNEDYDVEFEEELGGGVPLPDCVPGGIEGDRGGGLKGPSDGSGTWRVDGGDGSEGSGYDGSGGFVVGEVCKGERVSKCQAAGGAVGNEIESNTLHTFICHLCKESRISFT